MDEAVDIVLGNSIGNTLDTVDVDIRGRRAEAQIVRPPFVDRDPR